MKMILSIACILLLFMNATAQNIASKSDQKIIEFIPNFNFTGDCKENCEVYVAGNNTIQKIDNEIKDNKEHISLFVNCPSKFRLRKGKTYKFLAVKFSRDSCATTVDEVVGNQFYKLIKEIK